MNKNPLVSVIIACYNSEQYIDGCLQSLCEQTYKNIEIIICDDASTDRSLDVLRTWCTKDSRIKVLNNSSNLYAGGTRNRCFEIANGEYYLLQDIDDISSLNRIERLVSELMQSPYDFISSGVSIFKSDYKKPVSYYIPQDLAPSKWNFLWGVPFFHPATIFKSQCIKDIGGYRVVKETRRAEDLDLYMRLYTKGYRGGNIKDVLYYYRQDASAISRRDFKSSIEECKIRKFNYKNLGMGIIGFPFVFKPILGYIYQCVKFFNYR